jgi:tRNA dimethylallyltransferase
VTRMWQAGLVAEVRGLAAHGLREGRTASRALGYAQVLRFLAGEWSEQQAREETVRATRRFARRQDAWFRRDPRVSWLDAGSGAGQPGAGLAQRALATIGACGLITSSSPRDMAPRTTS